MKNFLFYNKKAYYFILFGIFILGAILRFKTYLYESPLWLDECQLAESILSRNINGFFTTLSRQQTAPPLFLSVVKLFTYQFGIKELAIRIFPFICGLISIPIFYKFSKLFLRNRLAIIFANFLFAINLQLIYYSQELKQYSSDVLFFMVLFIILNKLTLKNLSLIKIFLYSLGISTFPFFSIPTFFIIGSWYLREFILHKFKHFKSILFFSIPLITLTTFYYLNIIKPQHNIQIEGFGYFWNQGFISANFLKDLNILKTNLDFYFEPTTFTVLKISLLIVGTYLIFHNIKHKKNILLAGSIFFMLLFSNLHIYPLFERVSLYSLPILIVLIIKPLDFLSLNKKLYSVCILLINLITFSGYNPTYIFNFQTYNPTKIRNYPSNGKELMNILINNYKNDSCIVISHASHPEYFYYSNYYNFKPKCEINNVYPKRKLNYYKYLDSIKDGKFWFFYSFDYDHVHVIPILKEWAKNYTVIYEYELPDSYLVHIEKK